jgi:hypothetical protein
MSIQQHGDITELRKQLFESMSRLSGKIIDPQEIARAKAIAETAQTIINSAKVEVEFLQVTGGKQGSGFIPLAPANGHQVIEQRPGVTVRRHQLADN